MDTLLHPRLPPLLRSQPPVEAMSLFSSGNSKDDKAAQHAVGLNTIEDVRSIRETTTSEVTTVQQIDKQSSVPSAPLSWTTAITPAPVLLPAMPTSVSTPFVPSLLALKDVPDMERSMPNIPGASTVAQTPSIVMSEESATAQQSLKSAATDSAMLGFPRTQDSNSDEEMPEIDTRSDSD